MGAASEKHPETLTSPRPTPSPTPQAGSWRPSASVPWRPSASAGVRRWSLLDLTSRHCDCDLTQACFQPPAGPGPLTSSSSLWEPCLTGEGCRPRLSLPALSSGEPGLREGLSGQASSSPGPAVQETRAPPFFQLSPTCSTTFRHLPRLPPHQLPSQCCGSGAGAKAKAQGLQLQETLLLCVTGEDGARRCPHCAPQPANKAGDLVAALAIPKCGLLPGSPELDSPVQTAGRLAALARAQVRLASQSPPGDPRASDPETSPVKWGDPSQ